MKKIRHYLEVCEVRLCKIVLKNKTLAQFISCNFLGVYMRIFYFVWQRKHLSFRHPYDFNQWLLKVSLQNSKNPQMRSLIPQCVDKYAVREYIKGKGYGDMLNELVGQGVYDKVEDIDFSKLPQQFVMKLTNASGRNYICTDKNKCDWKCVCEQFTNWQNEKYFGWWTGEWQYALIRPRIVIERYLENLGETSLIDYKFNCIEGKVVSCFVAYNRDQKDAHNHRVCFDDYDVAWNRTEAIKDIWHTNRRLIPKPQSYAKMVEMAETCTKGFPFCRFDLYEIEGKILFGEMTFTPQGCVMEFYKDEWLQQMLSHV